MQTLDKQLNPRPETCPTPNDATYFECPFVEFDKHVHKQCLLNVHERVADIMLYFITTT